MFRDGRVSSSAQKQGTMELHHTMIQPATPKYPSVSPVARKIASILCSNQLNGHAPLEQVLRWQRSESALPPSPRAQRRTADSTGAGFLSIL